MLPSDRTQNPWPMLFTLVLASACADPLVEPSGPESMDRSPARAVVMPMCQQGCIDPDPEPESAGYFLSTVAPDACETYTDSDQDGLGDYCERRLAQAFAPQLLYWWVDSVGREPKWVARPSVDGNGTVRISYLLSYYYDAGSYNAGCHTLAGWPCSPHVGDSEVVSVDVTYDPGSGHWMTKTVLMSQHGTHVPYDWSEGHTVCIAGSCATSRLIFPDVPRGYPLVFVSEGKHANYATRLECEEGGDFNVDTCAENDTYARVSVLGIANIGSRAVHTASQDCWLSANPDYVYYSSNGRMECYWTGSSFRGWVPDAVAIEGSSSYSSELSKVGF